MACQVEYGVRVLIPEYGALDAVNVVIDHAGVAIGAVRTLSLVQRPRAVF